MCFVCCAVRVRSHAVGRCAVRCDAHMKVRTDLRRARGHLVVITFCVILNLMIRVSGVYAPCIINQGM